MKQKKLLASLRRKKKFYITWNRDSDEMFCQALLDAGYVRVNDPASADFIVHDAVSPGVEPYLKTKPSFITPHTPQSSFLWDGILNIYPTCCNFVYGEAAIKTLRSYDYPYRAEAVGFARCEVREFKRIASNNLLIVPSHRGPFNSDYTYKDYIYWATPVLHLVLINRFMFGDVTLCWDETRLDPSLLYDINRDMTIIPTNPYKDKEPLKQMMKRIGKADLVLSCGTVGCVSAAMGKPTIFFSEINAVPTSLPRVSQHSERYLKYLRFPLQAEEMTLDEIIATRVKPNPLVEYWKQQNIGGNFNAEKFIAIVKEYV
jgi:hypothetical protein